MTMGLPLSTQKLDTRKLGQNSNIKQKKLLKETLFILEVSVLSYFYKRNYFSTVLYIEKLANVQLWLKKMDVHYRDVLDLGF